ncbi:MAG: amidohydrolase [Acidobacteria bacterium]|nr:MAG: amidohydrolase [Acidobacteriota bacterium]
MRLRAFLFAVLLTSLTAVCANPPVSPAEFDQLYPNLEKLYVDLHQAPELSLHEEKTAARLVSEIKALGYDVTSGVGGYGVVAILRNGTGPNVLLRTDTDALPVEEKTGLPFASRVHTAEGTPVMHACGHDLHMTAWIGTAKWMASHKQQWSGTLIMIAQPAEEVVKGARAMLADGLYTRFPKPNFALAVHDASDLPTGKVGYTPGYALANSDSIDIMVFGKGGHGAQPQSTIDPIVIAARIVSGLQTLVSRQNNPLDPVVITVGQIHGGTKNNIIPDQVMLGLSVRTYKKDVRERVLQGIERVAKAEAELAGAPRAPEVKITEGTIAVYNDPKLTERLVGSLRRSLGDANVVEVPPKMVSEDFSYYAQDGIPEAMFHVGAVNPQKFADAQQSGTQLPSLHSALFAPDFQPTLRTAIQTEVTELLELMGK